ncbi:minichromosome maintenance protein MCM [Natrinema thermotolerans]|uniref:minichromosome maintenance protein MCM n=1 Tax=Natrinema thermotolerans TaxID=121872 RepID=UPI000679B1AB|nr:minichromosome maintenance protein MCM [Natrinema thermotolerans]QCC57278.1 hypothetical protein DVR14_00970 [Natrinema thermotolerans]
MGEDMFERLCETVAKPGIDSKVVQVAILQLVGGRERQQDAGAPIRDEIHVAIVADAAVNLSRFITALEDIIPKSASAHLNGTSTTHSGAIGSVKDEELSRGPFLDESTLVSYVEQADALDSRTTNALQQVLDSRRYSFTKRTYQSTVDAPGGIFLAANPPNGPFNDYEEPSDQLTIPLKVVKATDITLFNKTDSTEFSSTADPLSPDRAAEHILDAWSKRPTLTDDAAETIRDHVTNYRDAIADIDVGEYGSAVTFGPDRLEESMRRLTEAHAKARLEDEATVENAEAIVDLYEPSHDDLGVILPTDGTFDADIIETPDDSEHDLLSDDAKEQREALKEIVGDLEMEYDHGAPIDEIISRTGEIGMGPSKTEHLLDTLKQRGEAYEPRTDTLRTT